MWCFTGIAQTELRISTQKLMRAAIDTEWQGQSIGTITNHNQYYPTRPNRLATLGSRTFETLADASDILVDIGKTLLGNDSRCHRHSRSLQPCNLLSINHSSRKLLRRMPQHQQHIQHHPQCHHPELPYPQRLCETHYF